MRFKMCRKNEIKSAYDIALIVIDECCRTFFDRTKTAGRQPQVMDLFVEAIGSVICSFRLADGIHYSSRNIEPQTNNCL